MSRESTLKRILDGGIVAVVRWESRRRWSRSCRPSPWEG